MNTTASTASQAHFKNLPWIAACVLGFAAWTALGAITDRRESWDDPLYFLALLPSLSICAGIAGWLSPSRAALVAPALAAGQFAALVVQNPGGMNLWPFTLMFFVVFHVPAFLLALLGARLGRRATTR